MDSCREGGHSWKEASEQEQQGTFWLLGKTMEEGPPSDGDTQFLQCLICRFLPLPQTIANAADVSLSIWVFTQNVCLFLLIFIFRCFNRLALS